MPYCSREKFKQLNDLVAGQSPPCKHLTHLGRHPVKYYVLGMNLTPQFTDYTFGWVIRGSPDSLYVSSDHGDADLWVLHEHLVLEKGMSRPGALDLELNEVQAARLPAYLQARLTFFQQLIAAAETPGWVSQDPAPLAQATLYLEGRMANVTRSASATANLPETKPVQQPEQKTTTPAK